RGRAPAAQPRGASRAALPAGADPRGHGAVGEKVPRLRAMEPPGISDVLHPLLAGRGGKTLEDAELVEEQLTTFLAHRGLAVDEVHGRLVITAPTADLTPELAWAF